MPNRMETFGGMGVGLVIGKREGYRIWDLDGHELLDFHLNGGTFNVGHRNPQFLKVLHNALETLDVGKHHFASEARANLAEQLAAVLMETIPATYGFPVPSKEYLPGVRELVDDGSVMDIAR